MRALVLCVGWLLSHAAAAEIVLVLGGKVLAPAGTADEMIAAGAPRGLKMAMGENPKRAHGERKKAPTTRMGSAALMRQAFAKARDLLDARKRWAEGKAKAPPKRDLVSETLAD